KFRQIVNVFAAFPVLHTLPIFDKYISREWRSTGIGFVSMLRTILCLILLTLNALNTSN
ncbi:hypothetical protein L9F63_000468, partial [Diploptera punctata]